jgi:hypothetical protein
VRAELAARRTAAAELLADYELDDESAGMAGRAVWAGRLAAMLASILGALDALDRAKAGQATETRNQGATDAR